jgi:hypothetical protein
VKRLLSVWVGLVSSLLLVRPLGARADELAPELLTEELHEKARRELRVLEATLDEADRRKLVGTYVAFDPSASDPLAMAACDDDGDSVVVVSEAMLRLVDDVAHAESDDEATGTHRLEEHAAFLAASQLPGRRLLPPPPGFYAPLRGTSCEERLREALAFVLAPELERLRAGDLVCPHPTAPRSTATTPGPPTSSERRARPRARSTRCTPPNETRRRARASSAPAARSRAPSP